VNRQMKQMMAQAQRMQQEMLRMQEELADARVEGTAADGMVTATVSGAGELVGLSISPGAVDPDDVEMLEDMILVAVRNAVEKSREMSGEKMRDMGLPGMLGGMQ
jgi:DNA-binding YbaB/EbfC family protein